VGDPRRFDLFSSLIRQHFSLTAQIADVAGGKGYLQVALKEKGFTHITTFDKQRNPNKQRREYRWFDNSIIKPFDLLVGMHPDEATDVIIIEAAKRKIPFVICPCCVKPTIEPLWQSYTFQNWMTHLGQMAYGKGFKLQEVILPMNGRNKVLIGKF